MCGSARGFVFVVVAVAAVFVCVGVVAGAARPAGLGGVGGRGRVVGPGQSTFTDPVGDSGTAGDITTVIVSNDANGQITVQLNFAGALAATNTEDIYFDTDQNGATGDPRAAGAEFDLSSDQSTSSWDLGVWNGSAWVAATASASVSVLRGTSQLVFSINRSELGGTAGFNFWVDSRDGAGGSGHEDQAPDSGSWNYQLGGAAQAAATLRAVAVLAPRTARAGTTYLAEMAVQRSDTNGFLGSEGQIQCTATLAGRPLAAASGSFATVSYQGAKVSAAVCAWRLPKRARGKTLRGTITTSYQGAHVTRTFSATLK
jgi:hypothetical protein